MIKRNTLLGIVIPAQNFNWPFLSREIHGFYAVCFTVLICFILFAAGLIVSKERSFGFILKAFAIPFAALFLIFAVFFVWSALEHYYAKYIDAGKLQTPPDKLSS